MKQIIPTVKEVKITGEDTFLAKVNRKEYHGSFNTFGSVRAISFCKEVNSFKQTTWLIITVIETALNKL
jgi:hypothetical protein